MHCKIIYLGQDIVLVSQFIFSWSVFFKDCSLSYIYILYFFSAMSLIWIWIYIMGGHWIRIRIEPSAALGSAVYLVQGLGICSLVFRANCTFLSAKERFALFKV